MLEALAAELKLANVTFVGRVPSTEMGKLYDEADVYLNSSDIDNMPLSIIDSFAAGVPVVTTDAGGIPYVVRDGETGFLVGRGQHVDMAKAALRLLREPSLASHIADTARQECLDRYTWPAVQKEWEALYRGMVKG